MGKVTKIKSARKEWKCSKCHSIIKVGDGYFKGEINFGPTIVACLKCGLKPYEVTTSGWTRRVGRIVEDFTEDYGYGEDSLDQVLQEVYDIQSEVQDRLDNMPEGLQEGDVGQLLQSRVEMCDDAISELENIDVSDIKDAVKDEFLSNVSDELQKKFEDFSYDQIIESNEISDDIKHDMISDFEINLCDEISDALSSMEY